MQKVPLFLQPLVKYVDFKGRARRSEFWLWTLALFVMYIVIEAVMFSAIPAMMGSSNPAQAMANMMRFMPLINLIGLALFLPNLAVQIRRLHDSNRTGWWVVLPIGVFIAGIILFLATNASKIASMLKTPTASPDPTAIFSIVGSAMLFIWLPTMISGIVMLVFFCLDGTAGSNRFGPDPKGRGGDISVF